MCKRWNVLRMCPSLWKIVDVELYAWAVWNYLPSPGSEGSDVAECFIGTLPPSVTHMRLNFTFDPHLTDPVDFERLCMSLQEKCPHLKVFTLDNTKLMHSILSVIDLCTIYLENVRGLALHYCEFSYFDENENCISKIEFLDLLGCNLGNLGKWLFSIVPFLKELRLAKTDADDSWFENEVSFLNQLHVLDLGETEISFLTFQTIQNHGSNLKELYLCQTDDLEDGDLNFENSVFPQLNTVCLRSCRGVTCEGVISLIQSCQSLENAYVDEDMAVLYAAHPFIVVNKCKLGIVKAILHCEDHRKSDYLHE